MKYWDGVILFYFFKKYWDGEKHFQNTYGNAYAVQKYNSSS